MSEIKTKIKSSDTDIHSQNKVVKSYAQKLKSSVISTEHKKAILKEMRSELIAEQFCRPRKRPVGNIKSSALKSCVGNTAEYRTIQTGIDSGYIRTQRSAEYIRTAKVTYSADVRAVIARTENLEDKIRSADKAFRKKAVLRSRSLKQARLKNKKYTIAKADSEGSSVIEMAQAVHSAGSTAIQAGGMLKTSVKGVSNGVGKIHSMVKNGVRIGSAKDVGRIAAAAGGGVKNIAKDTGHQLLKTKIDKSTVTDTGTETLKQGLTELRYADNARKAVLNTSRTAVRVGRAVKNMPQKTKAQAERVKKNAKRAKETAKKTARIIRKIVTSKIGIIILALAAVILIVVLLLNGIITVICSAVSNTFAWLAPDGDTSKEAVKNNVNTYISRIQQYEADMQAEIDRLTELAPEYRYDGTQIEGLDNFNNRKLDFIDYDAVLAVLAAQKFQNVVDGNADDFKFTDEEIKNAAEMFYSFYYRYEYDYCPHKDCSKNENIQLSMAEGDFGISGAEYAGNGLMKITFQGTAYTHVSDMYINLHIYLKNGETLNGWGNIGAEGGVWSAVMMINTQTYAMLDMNQIYVSAETVYCDNPNHCYLYGDVVNYRLETVMQKAVFSDEQRELFEIYLANIKEIKEVG